MRATNILTEYLKNPIGISIQNPKITWNDLDGKKQTGFAIEYTINGKTYNETILSDEMSYVFKEKFNSRDYVTFKLKIRDENNVWGEYSDINSFEYGLLNQEDFIASWIRGNYKVSKKVRYPADYFKKEFIVKDVKKARLYISALGFYEAKINDKRVGEFVLAPGSTDYRKRVQYQTYDVTDLLIEGKNIIEIKLGDGWYRGSIGAKGFTYFFGKYSAIIAQLELFDSENKKTSVLTDNTWKWSNDGPIRFNDFKDGEIIDANLTESYGGFAKVLKTNKNLTCSNNVIVKEQAYNLPVRIIKNSKTNYIFEFKDNVAGYLSIKGTFKKNNKLDFVMGEVVKDNHLSLANIQCKRKGKLTPLQEFHYVAKDGFNFYKQEFYYGGFKYVELNADFDLDEIKDLEVKQVVIYSDIKITSSFTSSDKLLNILFNNTINSLKSNSIDVPTDCPQRERMGWTGDSQLFFPTASFLSDYRAFSRKHLVDVYDRQDKNGRLPQIAPYNHEDFYMKVMNGSSGWADVGVLMPYYFYKKYNDPRILEEFYDDMLEYAKYIIHKQGVKPSIYMVYTKPICLKKGLNKYLSNNAQSYGEWAEPNDIHQFIWLDLAAPHPEVQTAYASFVLDKVYEIAHILGKKDDKLLLKIKEYADGAKLAYQDLRHKKRFSLDTNNQASLVRPLYMNLLDEDDKKYAKDRLIKALDNYDWKLGTGFLSTPFILDVLSEIDPEYAYKLLDNEKMPGWKYMAIHDTGSIWENWEGPTTHTDGSLNHYSKGALCDWLIRGMCGINIGLNNTITIKPIVGGKITNASATYDSIYGKVVSSYELDDKGEYHYHIEVPSNVTATISLPNKETVTVCSGIYNF